LFAGRVSPSRRQVRERHRGGFERSEVRAEEMAARPPFRSDQSLMEVVMGLILLIVIVVLLFGGGGGYYAHSYYGGPGLGGVLGLVVLVLLVVWFFGGGVHRI
jgi:hypothetical protein